MHEAIKDGARFSARDPLGYTALHRAVDEGSEKHVALLLEAGAALGDATGADFMIRRGKAVDSRDNNDATPLMHAAGNGHSGIIDLLVGAGADLAAHDEFRLTPLHYAAESGHVGAVEALLRHGANIDAYDENGKTAADVAQAWGFPDVVKLLGPSITLHDTKERDDSDEDERPAGLPEGAMPLFPKRKPPQANAEPPPSVGPAAADDSRTGGRRKKTMRMPDNLMPEKLEL